MSMIMTQRTKVLLLSSLCVPLLSLVLYLTTYKISKEISIFQSMVDLPLVVSLFLLTHPLRIFHCLLLLIQILNLYYLRNVLRMTWSIFHLIFQENTHITQKLESSLKTFLQALGAIILMIVSLCLTLKVVFAPMFLNWLW